MAALGEQGPGPEFAYIDESGDTGRDGSKTYTLGCVMIPMAHWTSALDHIIKVRREIKADYGLTMSTEVKANHLVGVKKTYSDLGLGDGQVRDIFQRHIDAATQVSSGVGAVVINKSAIHRPDIDVFDTSWECLFTRLRKRSETSGQPIVIVHDKGEEDRVRKHLRRFRRGNWQGSAYGEARLLVEDPVARDSQHSYLIQIADLVTYSASRFAVPTIGKTTKICDPTMWRRTDTIQMKEFSVRRDGIYLWPSGV